MKPGAAILVSTGTGVKAISWTLSTRHTILLILAIPTLAGAAVFLALTLSRPQPLAETAMGDQWQCSKTAYIVTTCTKKPKQAIARTPVAALGYVAAG
jgi:hypothetical protein